jgi:hypothetical protein
MLVARGSRVGRLEMRKPLLQGPTELIERSGLDDVVIHARREAELCHAAECVGRARDDRNAAVAVALFTPRSALIETAVGGGDAGGPSHSRLEHLVTSRAQFRSELED